MVDAGLINSGRKSLRKKWMVIWLIISISLLTGNAAAVLVNSHRIDKLNRQNERILILMKNVDDIQNSTLHGLDLGIRGFGLSENVEMMGPYEEALIHNGAIFSSIYQEAAAFQYPLVKIDCLSHTISEYMNLCIYMKNLIVQDSTDRFRSIISTDPGLAVWKKYDDYRQDIFLHLALIRDGINKDIEVISSINFILQLIVILLVIPSIILLFFTLKKLIRDLGNQNMLVDQKKSELQYSRDFLSHIIRGPICRLLGLLYLLDKDDASDKEELLQKIHHTVDEIDELTRSYFV